MRRKKTRPSQAQQKSDEARLKQELLDKAERVALDNKLLEHRVCQCEDALTLQRNELIVLRADNGVLRRQKHQLLGALSAVLGGTDRAAVVLLADLMLDDDVGLPKPPSERNRNG